MSDKAEAIEHKAVPIWVTALVAAFALAGGGAAGSLSTGGITAQEVRRVIEKVDTISDQISDIKVALATWSSMEKRLDAIEARMTSHQKDGHPTTVIQMLESFRRDIDRRLENLEKK